MGRSYQDLQVWQEAMDVARRACRAAGGLRCPVAHAVADQIRAAALSIPASLVEGYGRESSGAVMLSLQSARGSLAKLEANLSLAQRVGLLDAAAVDPILARAQRLARTLSLSMGSAPAYGAETPPA
jgi:four helix bundle protein